MNRRDFMKTGTMAFSLTAAGGWAFDFTPDDDFGNVYNHCLPFRKEPRGIREEVAGFLWADAADFQSYRPDSEKTLFRSPPRAARLSCEALAKRDHPHQWGRSEQGSSQSIAGIASTLPDSLRTPLFSPVWIPPSLLRSYGGTSFRMKLRLAKHEGLALLVVYPPRTAVKYISG